MRVHAHIRRLWGTFVLTSEDVEVNALDITRNMAALSAGEHVFSARGGSFVSPTHRGDQALHLLSQNDAAGPPVGACDGDHPEELHVDALLVALAGGQCPHSQRGTNPDTGLHRCLGLSWPGAALNEASQEALCEPDRHLLFGRPPVPHEPDVAADVGKRHSNVWFALHAYYLLQYHD